MSFSQVTDQLQRVNFRDQFGHNVFFDVNGDPPASYDIINWQLIDGQVQHVTLGHFASDVNGNHRLSIQEEEIVWRTGKMVIMKAFFHMIKFYTLSHVPCLVVRLTECSTIIT